MLDHLPTPASLRFRLALSLLVASLWTTPLLADCANELRAANRSIDGNPLNWTVVFLDGTNKYFGMKLDGTIEEAKPTNGDHSIPNRTFYTYFLETEKHEEGDTPSDWSVIFEKAHIGNEDSPTNPERTGRLREGIGATVCRVSDERYTGKIANYALVTGFPIENTGHGPAQDIAFLSRLVLTGAYFISVTYYLQLLAAFVLNAVGMDSQTAAHGITTLLFLTIGGIGMWRGLGELESVEKYTVSMNLGMIGALLVSLALYNVQLLRGGTWAWPSIASTISTNRIRTFRNVI